MMINPDNYPENWTEIANYIKAIAGNRCQYCGHVHSPLFGYTLTTHHLDGNPLNNSITNLRAICQRCHLAVQFAARKRGRGIARDLFPNIKPNFPHLKRFTRPRGVTTCP